MRNQFPGYYRPTNKEFDVLWSKADFAFDANVLLNVYRYTPDTAQKLLDTLEAFKARIWLPHQAGLEFHERRLDVIAAQWKTYQSAQYELDRHLKALEDSYRRHSLLGTSNLPKLAAEFTAAAKAELEVVRSSHPDYSTDDLLLGRITELFEGRVGNPFTEQESAAIRREGERRYALRIPPGWRDETKGDTRQFGDLIIWKQILDRAKAKDTPVVFVTDNRKDDWWREHDGKTVGPQPALIAEAASNSGQEFYMYRPEQFLEHAARFVKIDPPSQAIEEVQEVRAERERRVASIEVSMPSATLKRWKTWRELRRVLQADDSLEETQSDREPSEGGQLSNSFFEYMLASELQRFFERTSEPPHDSPQSDDENKGEK